MTKMVEVTQEDANNYCRVLTALGMEKEGDPVAGIERLRLKCEEHRDGRLAALEKVAALERRLQEVGDLAASSATGPAQRESLKMIEELCGLGA